MRLLMDSSFGQRFMEIRKEKGLNKKQIADALGVPSSIISDIENEKRQPSKDFLIRFSVYFEISLNWLCFGIEPKSLVKSLTTGGHKEPLITEIEKLIKRETGGYGQAISSLEERITKLENQVPEAEYPTDEPGGGYTAEPEPEYEESAGPVAFREQIAAGPPIDQSDEESLVVDVPLRHIKTDLRDYYALRVQGNSMIDALIQDGSMVLIRKSDTPVNGAIQVVSIDGQATLKRLREGENHSWTVCYEDGSGRTIAMGEGLRVQGDFVAVLPPSTRPRMRCGE
jgi:SOS-response transcriptional repressor LexA